MFLFVDSYGVIIINNMGILVHRVQFPKYSLYQITCQWNNIERLMCMKMFEGLLLLISYICSSMILTSIVNKDQNDYVIWSISFLVFLFIALEVRTYRKNKIEDLLKEKEENI